MGVYHDTYLFYGYRLDPSLFDWDNSIHEACANGEPNAPFDIVYDQMSLNYMFVGQIVAMSDPYSGFEVKDVTKLLEVTQTEFNPEKIAEVFDIQGLTPKLLLFTHFY